MADVTDKDREAARAGGFITLGVNEDVLARDAERAIAAARAEEREACAKVCEAIHAECWRNPGPCNCAGATTCAAAIRARGEQGGK